MLPVEINVLDTDKEDITSSCFTAHPEFETKRKVPYKTTKRWIKAVLGVLYLDITFSIIVCIIDLVLLHGNSDSMLVLTASVDILLHVISCVTIIWYFHVIQVRDNAFSEFALSNIALLVAIIFLGSPVPILIESVIHLIAQDKPTQSLGILISVLVTMIIHFAMFFIKINLAEKLCCKMLRTNAYDSLESSGVSFSVLLGCILFKFFPNFWYLDACFSLVIASIAAVSGLYIIYKIIRNRPTISRLKQLTGVNPDINNSNFNE